MATITVTAISSRLSQRVLTRRKQTVRKKKLFRGGFKSTNPNRPRPKHSSLRHRQGVENVKSEDQIRGRYMFASLYSVQSIYKPQFGSANGLIAMADDFNDPLEDFSEYMG
jgi:hypothetical protein